VITIPAADEKGDFQPFAERIRSRHWNLADDGGRFAIPAAPGSYRLEVVDVATGVMLGRSQENGEVRSGRPLTMDLRIEVVEMTIELETERAQHGVERLEIRAGDEVGNRWQWDATLFGGGQHGNPGVDLRGVERRARCYVLPGSVEVGASAVSRLARGSIHWGGPAQTETFAVELGKPVTVTMKLPPPNDLDGK